MAGRKGGLGKGLDALFADNDTGSFGTQVLRISEIEPNKAQPRKEFDEATLADLADSIREHGVLQPLLVRPLSSGDYQLIAGERRWRAARMAGLIEVPVVVREMDDQEEAEIALIENLQRQDLNPMEESLGYQNLQEKYGLTQEQIAKSVGKSRPVITNALRLLKLPEAVQEMLRKNEITTGHARALLSIEDGTLVAQLAQEIRRSALSVRETERRAADAAQGRSGKKARSNAGQQYDRFIQELQLAATEELGRTVRVQEKGNAGGGTITLEYFNRNDLSEIMERLTGEKLDLSTLNHWHE